MPLRSRTAAHRQLKPMEAKSLKVRQKAMKEKGPSPSAATLPEWNLADLYAGMDAPEVKRDLDRADSYSVAFEETFRGKLAGLAAGPDGGAQLAEAISRY